MKSRNQNTTILGEKHNKKIVIINVFFFIIKRSIRSFLISNGPLSIHLFSACMIFILRPFFYNKRNNSAL